MLIDAAVIPGLLLLAGELLVLAAIGYIVARVALRQTDDRLALAQGLVIGLALWGLAVNFLLHVFPGMAGALAGWIVVLALGVGLAWRGQADLGIPARTLAGFGLAGAAIFWIALASRQLLIIPDHILHTMIPATIRAGGWPPTLGWNPDLDLAYHHGIDLLVALLTPPTGPDLAFTTELLGAYAWTALILLTAALLMRGGSWAGKLALMPLLLAPGAWTLVFGEQPTLLQSPIPTGLPEAGVRAALAEVYWPAVELPWPTERQGVPPNIWKPSFALAYGLAFVALERIAVEAHRRWPASLTLAALVGFLGLLDETVAPIALGLWILAEGATILRVRPKRTQYPAAVLRAAAGPLLAVAILFASGGVFTGILTGSSGSGELTLGWPLDPRGRGAVSSVTTLDAGLGLLSLGSIVVAGIAAVIDRRNRLVLLLVAATGAFVLAALVLRYDIAPHDIGRFDGHARNFSLLALLVALSVRLAALRPRWRYAAAAFVLFLVSWPTVAAPARKLGLAIGHGVQIANARPGPSEFGEFFWWMGRYPLERFPSDRIAEWLRENTNVDARILSPAPYALTVATGRPNASGFAEILHTRPYTGPGYLDALRYLEPAAFRRLEIAYVHAPNDWAVDLPDQAARWLESPQFFEPVIRDDMQALFRVRPAFLQLDDQPAPLAFESLRNAIPAESTVYLSPANGTLDTFRAVAVLPHARLLGSPNRAALHLQAEIRTTPLRGQSADFVVTSSRLAPSMFQPAARRPVFWNQNIAVYAPNGTTGPVSEAPPRPFSIQLGETRESDGRIAFTATLTARSGEGWTGQDWLVVPADDSPWALPRIRPTDPAVQWFAGQAKPRPGSITHRYEYDPQAVTLSLRDAQPDTIQLDSSGDRLEPGVWILAVRLRSDYQLSGFIPVVKIVVSQAGDVSYEVYEGEFGVNPSPRPPEP
ncbi:MAG: hypothetical protein OXP73_10415 [Chloroflexota bacterium]|nr:hypothetical protein [Chloroflexota bacterium]